MRYWAYLALLEHTVESQIPVRFNIQIVLDNEESYPDFYVKAVSDDASVEGIRYQHWIGPLLTQTFL